MAYSTENKPNHRMVPVHYKLVPSTYIKKKENYLAQRHSRYTKKTLELLFFLYLTCRTIIVSDEVPKY